MSDQPLRVIETQANGTILPCSILSAVTVAVAVADDRDEDLPVCSPPPMRVRQARDHGLRRRLSTA